MSRPQLDTSTAAWKPVREAAETVAAMLGEDQVDLVDFGKAYAEFAMALCVASRAGGTSSMRFEAAALALDLRTKKSALEEFLQRQ